jgi:hypothetical protein
MIRVASSILALSVVVAACASQEAYEELRSPDGTTWLGIPCKPPSRECDELAHDRCPMGYDVAGDADAREATVVTRSHSGNITTDSALHPRRGEMLIRCK